MESKVNYGPFGYGFRRTKLFSGSRVYMGPKKNYGPILTKFHSVISSPKKLWLTKFCYDNVIFYGFRRTKLFSGRSVYMGLRVNYGRIFTKFNSVIFSWIKLIFAKSCLIPRIILPFMLVFVSKLSIFFRWWFHFLIHSSDPTEPILLDFNPKPLRITTSNLTTSLFISFEFFES